MFGNLDKYLAVFFTGLAVSYLLTPVVRALACKWGIVDQPNARRAHKHPTARGGGVAVVIAVHAACFMAVLFPWPEMAGGLNFDWWKRFAIASAVLFVVGIVDDVKGMKPLVKLGGQIIAALIMALSGTRFGQLLGYDLPMPVDCILVVFWLVALVNAFNLIDGLDGLASGLAIISALGLCGVLLLQHLPADVLILLGFVGACLGFLRYNFHPATVFLGDTGSMFLGFTLGVAALQTFNKGTLLVSLTIPLMVLGIPIYDALLAFWRRSARLWSDERGDGAKRGIMQPDMEHLHHRLIKSGLSTRRVAMFLYLLNGAFIMVGLLMTWFDSHAKGIFLIALLAGAYVLMRHLAVIELRETGRALLKGLQRPSHATLKALAYPVWDMFWLSGSLALIMWELEEQKPGFWRSWFLDLPLWVTPTFFLLSLSRTYITYWPRARLRDVLMVLFWLQMGLLFSLGLALIMDPDASQKWALRALLIAGISHPVIMASRLVYRCVDELVVWLRKQGESQVVSDRVLLYGAGVRAQLFLKDHAVRSAKSHDNRVIVGFIDDETSLYHQWVYGQVVLGGLKDLPDLTHRHKVTRIIIVADLQPSSRAAIHQAAAQLGIPLTEWYSEEHPVGFKSSETSVTLPNLIHQNR